MKKLIQGIIDFRRERRAEYRQKFAQLALGQSPDALFIACSDSRVVPNLFASTDPGDLFVIRNVGNLVPPHGTSDDATADQSVWAAIEFALLQLQVSDIIVCGHSECGAINAMLQGREQADGRHLRAWLQYAENAGERQGTIRFDATLTPHNQTSQANVLLQLEHLATHPLIHARLDTQQLRLHGWWFDIGAGDVYAFDRTSRQFLLVGE